MKFKSFIAALHAALLCILLAASPAGSGSMTLLGVGKAGAAAAFVGPGDVLTYTSYYALRAYSAATRGNKLVNVCNSTGGVDVGCADMLSDAVTGNLVPQTISSITCPGANCTIKTYYDLVSTNDVTQNTVANRHALTTSCVGITAGMACGLVPGGSTTTYVTSGNITFTAPTTFTFVGSTAFSAGATEIALTDASNTVILYYLGGNSAHVTSDGATNHLDATATQGAVRAISGLANSASSYLVVDSSAPVTGSIASNLPVTQLLRFTGDAFGNSFLAGSTIQEGGYLAAAPSSAAVTSVHANAKAYWGY